MDFTHKVEVSDMDTLSILECPCNIAKLGFCLCLYGQSYGLLEAVFSSGEVQEAWCL